MTPPAKPPAAATAFHRLDARDVVRGMVPTVFLRLLAEYLQQHGLAPAELMPAEALRSGAGDLGRYPAEAWCELLRTAAQHLRDPLLGLHLGQSLQPAHLGALGYLLIACDTLGDALLSIEKYHRLVHDLNPVRFQVSGDALVLEWGVAHGKPGALFDETGLCALVQCSRLLCGQDIRVRRVDFVNPAPGEAQAFIDFFGGVVHWSQHKTRLVVSTEILGLRLQRADPALRGLMAAQVDEALARLPESGDVVELTRKIVQRLAEQGSPALEQIAAELRLSPRALYRLLAERGQQFRQLRDEALRELAETHLRNPALSLAEVSSRLGYTEQSAFSRAFKRWSGAAPLQWRRSLSGRLD